MNKIGLLPKSVYRAPWVEVMCSAELSLLAALSVSAGFDEFELGDGPTEEFEYGEDI